MMTFTLGYFKTTSSGDGTGGLVTGAEPAVFKSTLPEAVVDVVGASVAVLVVFSAACLPGPFNSDYSIKRAP